MITEAGVGSEQGNVKPDFAAAQLNRKRIGIGLAATSKRYLRPRPWRIGRDPPVAPSVDKISEAWAMEI